MAVKGPFKRYYFGVEAFEHVEGATQISPFVRKGCSDSDNSWMGVSRFCQILIVKNLK